MDAVELYGMEWLDETYRLIQEEKREEYLILMTLLPIARTPMEEKSSRWLRNYTKDVRNMLYQLTPWDRGGSIRSTYRGKVKSGTVGVILDDAKMKDHPTFAGAKVIKT